MNEIDFTARSGTVVFADELPELKMRLDTPYLSEIFIKKWMEDPLYAMILGNRPGMRRVDDPAPRNIYANYRNQVIRK